MKRLIHRIGSFYRKDAAFSEEKTLRIEYTLSAMWNEISKVFLFSLVFCLLGRWQTFALVYVCLISIRLFAGGIHCGTYIHCLFFSFAFLCICVYCPAILDIHPTVLLTLSCLSILFVLLFAPVLPKVRSLKSRKQFWTLKALSLISTMFWISVACLYRKTDMVSSNLLWTIILANYQLVFPYWSYQKERRKEKWRVS